VGLGIGLIVLSSNSARQQRDDAATIGVLSNKVVKTTADLEETKQLAAELEKDIEKQKQSFLELTNAFTQVSGDLAKTSTNLLKTELDLKASQAEVAKCNTVIADLEARNQALDAQAQSLSIEITNKNTQIADIQRKLAASEGDKAFLTRELTRLMSEKAELEKQFNDLNVLRAQVAKLKEELNIARRIEWIRQGLFASADAKGAQKLMQGFNAGPQAQVKPPQPKPAYDLNVEVNADGSVKVIPPLGKTNVPPAASAPPK
jgi:chromosome segregation ATPase